MVKKICKNCVYFEALYVKGGDKFIKQVIALCRKDRKVITAGKTCDDWVCISDSRKSDRKEVKKEFAISAIDKMQKNLSEIRQILSED